LYYYIHPLLNEVIMLWANLVRLILMSSLLGSMVACSGTHRAWESEDSWYRRPPTELNDVSAWLLLESSSAHEIIGTLEQAAEESLNKSPYFEITTEQVKKLTEGEFISIPKTKPYLVRSVFLNKGTGAYYLRVKNGNLWIHHASLGKGPVPMRKQAIVVQLQGEPNEVYVTCSMAE
jgi:hypothetical protein